MQQLSLSQDKPEDFEGRCLSLHGRDYRIGASFREDGQGYAHLLCNKESGLCLHVIQIRPEYRDDPDMALAASRHKADVTAKLRSEMRLKQPGVRIPGISVIEANGGSFELHEGAWGVFDSRKGAPGKVAFEAAVSRFNDGYVQAAIEELEALLAQYPNHTEALALLADCKASLGEHGDALRLVEKAIAIEPNSFNYLGMRVAHARNASYRFMALGYFEALRKRFPLIDDFNAYGVQCYLDCGEPGKAEALLEQSRLPDDQTKRFEDAIAKASFVDAAYGAIEEKMRSSGHRLSDEERKQLLEDLQALHERYPAHPWIQANLGLMLRKSGQPESAAEFLNQAMSGLPLVWMAFCAANCGFSMAEARRWDSALFSFNTTIALLRDLNEGKFEAVDVPGLAVWLFRDGHVIEDLKSNPVALVDRAAENASSPELVTPNVRLYRKLLAQALDYYAGQADSKSPPFGFLLVLVFALNLAGLAFFGAIGLFSMPFDQGRATFGGVLVLSVAVTLLIARRIDYVKTFFLHHLPLFVLSAIGFVAGVVVAVVRSSSG